ncbi:MAG TPA: cbb3-type cytochrome c oxidase subunit 3 [Thiothrix sp.]|nr:cbb3-type cytochrome c oxidase subunit 3 [Thiothrix sp.]
MMSELFSWFMDITNSKISALLIFFITFVAILFYVYGSKGRSERLESYRNIPFLDDDNDKDKDSRMHKTAENNEQNKV